MNYQLKDIFLVILLIAKNIFYASKKNDQDYTLVTAVDDLHFIYLENLIENYKKNKNIFNKFIVYGLNLSHELQIKIGSYDFVEFREFDFNNYPQHFNLRLKEHNNKIGGFAWKPAIILELYNEQKHFNVIWLDSACLFNLKIILFKFLVKDRGFASFHSTGNLIDWTYKSVLKENDILDKVKILNSRNLMGGVLGFNLKNQNTVKLLKSWYELCLIPTNIFPDGSSIKNHRHDQSLLSICYWNQFTEALPTSTKLFGIKIQNWPNKILYFFDEKNNYRKMLLEKYLFYSTTTNSRCKIIVLFKPESLKFIPIRLLLKKKVLLFISSDKQIKTLQKYKLKKFLIYIYAAFDVSLKKSKKINFEQAEIENIIYKEYVKEVNA
tara:strand:- start:1100 stop:2242 length:1143 start_codon:yes stop_codon:yes gene_type:complete